MRVRVRAVPFREAPARQARMRYADLCSVTEPVVSVITPSLNHAKFLRATIESVAAQTFRNFEHIVVDGKSTDGTIEILKEYPHLKWISEPDNSVLDAYQKALRLARGRYIVQCCVSDGFLAPGWFGKCVALLDVEKDVSLVWALPQYMSEEGALLRVAFQEFLEDPPPQKEDFLPFWLATRIVLPEGNYCVRASVLRETFPDEKAPEHYRIHCHLGFMYNFMTRGYCPLYVPEVVSYGRLHASQRGQRLQAVEKPAFKKYLEEVNLYRKQVFRGKIVHVFRDGNSAVKLESGKPTAGIMRRKYWEYRLLRSKAMQITPYSLFAKLKTKIRKLS
jgi:glycosyltransferase involved in cell wall biosynthesis